MAESHCASLRPVADHLPIVRRQRRITMDEQIRGEGHVATVDPSADVVDSLIRRVVSYVAHSEKETRRRPSFTRFTIHQDTGAMFVYHGQRVWLVWQSPHARSSVWMTKAGGCSIATSVLCGSIGGLVRVGLIAWIATQSATVQRARSRVIRERFTVVNVRWLERPELTRPELPYCCPQCSGHAPEASGLAHW